VAKARAVEDWNEDMHVSVKNEICILMDARQSATKPHALVLNARKPPARRAEGFAELLQANSILFQKRLQAFKFFCIK
jgi:hypothetical protein